MPFSRRQTDVWDDANNSDFVIRQRFRPLWQMILLFAACYFLILFIALNSADVGGVWGTMTLLLLIIGPLCWVTVYLAQFCRDMLLATEFQNLMFASSLRLKTKFCLIVKKDGSVVYIDPNFQKLFPETVNRGSLVIDKIFNEKHIAPVESRKLFQALDAGEAATIFINLPDPEKQTSERAVVSIEPLPRPKDYYLLRGRKYYTKKFEASGKAGQGLEGTVSENSAATLGNMLHTLPFGILTLDMDGHIEFANYHLEKELGYEQNELSSRPMNLNDLLSRKNTPTIQHLLLRDTSGDLVLLNKRGREVALHAEQKISYNEQNQATGAILILRESDLNLDEHLASNHRSGNSPLMDDKPIVTEPQQSEPQLTPSPRLAPEPTFNTTLTNKAPGDDSSI